MTIIKGIGVPTPPRKKISEEHYPAVPWKYIAIAGIAAASILGLIAATDFFSNTATTSTSTGWQPPPQPQPADPEWIPPNEPDDPVATPTPAEIFRPDEIAPFCSMIDISNPPKFVRAPSSMVNLLITDLEIKDGKIKAAFYNNRNPDPKYPKLKIAVRPIKIYFFDAQKNSIRRPQWTCEYKWGEEGSYRMTNAHCQWPEDYCSPRSNTWMPYWKYDVPTIQPNEKYEFSVKCAIPKKTKYIVITE